MEFAEAGPGVTAMERLAAFPPPRRSSAGLMVAWVLTFAMLAGAVAAVIIEREAVMRAWPPSALILAAFDHTAPQPAQIMGTKAQ
jgi:hypothetical protein